jgi:hypothetical protein
MTYLRCSRRFYLRHWYLTYEDNVQCLNHLNVIPRTHALKYDIHSLERSGSITDIFS